MKTETIALSNVDLLAIHYDSLWELCVLGCKQEQNVMLQQYDKIEVLFLIPTFEIYLANWNKFFKNMMEWIG